MTISPSSFAIMRELALLRPLSIKRALAMRTTKSCAVCPQSLCGHVDSVRHEHQDCEASSSNSTGCTRYDKQHIQSLKSCRAQPPTSSPSKNYLWVTGELQQLVQLALMCGFMCFRVADDLRLLARISGQKEARTQWTNGGPNLIPCGETLFMKRLPS